MNTQTELTQTDDADIAALEAEARDLSEDDFIGLPLKFVKSKWLKVVDKEKQEQISGTMPFVVDIRSYKRGWIKWQDRKPVFKLLGRPIDNFVSPVRDLLGDLDKNRWPRNNKNEPIDPWQENFSIVMRDVTCGDLVTWTTTSWFGQKALGALLTATCAIESNTPVFHPSCCCRPRTSQRRTMVTFLRRCSNLLTGKISVTTPPRPVRRRRRRRCCRQCKNFCPLRSRAKGKRAASRT